MKSGFKNALLSSVVLLVSFGSIAKSNAQVPPLSSPGMAWGYDYHAISQIMSFHQSFVNSFFPVASLIGAIKANSDAINVRTGAMYNELIAIKVNTGQTVANTNQINANLNRIDPNILNISNNIIQINPNILNISNKINDMAVWLKEVRDFLLGIDGLGGLSNIPWFNDLANKFPRVESTSAFKELYVKVRDGEEYIESPALTQSLHDLVTRYSLENTLVEADTLTPEQAKEQHANFGNTITGLLATGVAERSYTRGNESMLRLQAYLDALQNSETIKKSLDINTRVLIEIAQTNNELLKTISIFNVMQGASTLSNSADLLTDEEAEQ
jgi:hypothetical protein